MNQELPDVEAGLRKGRGTRNQIADTLLIIKKKKKKLKTEKHISASLTMLNKAFDCVDDNKLWKILKEMGIPDYLTCHLRNVYAGQEATVRTGHGDVKWFLGLHWWLRG